MTHLIELGQNIVRGEYPDEPNKHSRLWIQEEIEHVLADNSGSETTRCIIKDTHGINLKGLGNMKKLKCLTVKHGVKVFSYDRVNYPWYCFGRFWNEKDRQYFPNSLQYLYWVGYPHWWLPKTFDANNLVTLEMPCSKIKQLWACEKVMKKLKFLDLRRSKMLRSLDLGLTPNLERLNLEDCDELEKLDVQGGCLKSLVYLNLRYCERLKSVSFIEQLESLEVLHLRGLHLKKFPEWHSINSLLELELSWNDIEEVPSSIGNLHKLVYLNLSSCCNLKSLPSSIGNLHKLVFLELSGCHSLKSVPGSICSLQHLTTLGLTISGIVELPEEIGQLECLEYLYLSHTKVKHLPDSIFKLKCLKTLDLYLCFHLKKLTEDVGQLESLEILNLSFCYNLREIPNSICNLKCLKKLLLWGCEKVEKLPDEIGDLKSLEELDVRDTGITQLPQSLSLLKGLKKIRR